VNHPAHLAQAEHIFSSFPPKKNVKQQESKALVKYMVACHGRAIRGPASGGGAPAPAHLLLLPLVLSRGNY
jgi:hypothetical protein